MVGWIEVLKATHVYCDSRHTHDSLCRILYSIISIFFCLSNIGMHHDNNDLLKDRNTHTHIYWRLVSYLNSICLEEIETDKI